MSEKPEPVGPSEETESSKIHIFVYIKDGEVSSILSNKDDLNVDIIDQDLADICEDVAALNEVTEAAQKELWEEVGDLYEYIPQEEETAATEEELK